MDALLVERTSGFVFVDQLHDALADPPEDDEVRPLGESQAGRTQRSSSTSSSTYGTSELVPIPQLRSAWAALGTINCSNEDRSEQATHGGLQLVERSAKALHPTTPPEPDWQPSSSGPSSSSSYNTKHHHHHHQRQGITRLFAGRGQDHRAAWVQHPAVSPSLTITEDQ